MLDLKRHLAATRGELKRFGLVFLAIMALLTAYLLWKDSPAWPSTAIAGAIFLVLAVAIPEALRPLYVVWMAIGAVLAWVNTRIILGAVFYLVMTPIGLLMKLGGKDILGTRIDPDAATYWVAQPPDDRGARRYEQMF